MAPHCLDYLHKYVPDGATRSIELKGELVGSLEGVAGAAERGGKAIFTRAYHEFTVTIELASRPRWAPDPWTAASPEALPVAARSSPI